MRWLIVRVIFWTFAREGWEWWEIRSRAENELSKCYDPEDIDV